MQIHKFHLPDAESYSTVLDVKYTDVLSMNIQVKGDKIKGEKPHSPKILNI